MLYLMTVLTFLAGIVFYLLSPRDDRLQLDTYQAEPLIQDLISQHQAAKDYLRRWFGANLSDLDAKYFNLYTKEDENGGLVEFLPVGITHSMCEDNSGAYPEFKTCFLSRVICTGQVGENKDQLIACNSNARDVSYVVTYGGWGEQDAEGYPTRPGWWPNRNSSRPRRNERWRRAIAKRTHGSLNCGTLYQVGSDWCLDNGQVSQEKRFGEEETRCLKKIPQGVIAGLKIPGKENDIKAYLFDMLLCISPVVQGPAHYYPYGLTNYFDGLDNWNKHAQTDNTSTHKKGKSLWYDLVENVDVDSSNTKGVAGSYDTVSETFSPMSSFEDPETPYFSLALGDTIDFNISPNNDFTISTVVAFDDGLSGHNMSDIQADLIKFQGSNEGEDNTPTVKISIQGTDREKAQLTFEISKKSSTWYKFLADMSLVEFRPFTLTLARRGNYIDIYLGGHETQAEREKKLFSGRMETDEVRTVFNNALDSKMSIVNRSSRAKVQIYAVRAFNRALGADEVYKLYKEDLRRYDVTTPSSYNNEFFGTIEWRDQEDKR